jgi:hypothetical protein
LKAQFRVAVDDSLFGNSYIFAGNGYNVGRGRIGENDLIRFLNRMDKKFDIIKPCGDKVGIGVDRAAGRVNACKIRANSAVSVGI